MLNPRSGDVFVVARAGYELSSERLEGSHGGLEPDEVRVPLIVNKPEYADLLKGADLTIVERIVARYLREARAMGVVKERLERADPAHGWEHTARVLSLATRLALECGADVEAVRLACLFHDAGRGLDPRGHEERGAQLAEEFLRREGCPRELVEKVKRAVLKHHARPNELDTVEEKVVWDADKLDALGLVGLARCLLEAGFRREGIEEALEHYARDLRELGNAMHLGESRRVAEERTSRALQFIRCLEEELEGNW